MKNNRFVAAVLVPGFLFLLIFSVFPVVYGLGISLYDYNPANSEQLFLGLENYRRLVQDEVFWKAVKNTLFFCIVAVAANLVITLFLAKIISVLPSKRIKTLFRTILFIPCIAPMVGTSMVWKFGIVETDGGLINQIRGLFGLGAQNWYLTTTAQSDPGAVRPGRPELVSDDYGVAGDHYCLYAVGGYRLQCGAVYCGD